MAFKRKDVGRGYSPARKPMSRSTLGLGSCRSPRRGLSTSFQAHSKPTVSARPGARIGGKPVHSSQGSTANMKVVVRVRPLSERERESNTKTIVDIVDEKMLVFDPKREEESFFFRGAKQRGRDMMKKPNKHTQFLFDSVFGCEATNEAVFEGSTKGIVSSVLDGFNCSVFVYGATGAGKTFTMLGTQENPGITFRTMVDLFRQMDDQQKEKDFEIGVSYLEVYNEAVKDLLNPNSGPVHLREEGGNVYASGLKTEMITDPNHMFSLLEYGNKNRTQEATDANSESSRSHAVFQVFIKIKIKTNGQTKMVKLSMIDLAGSERGAATGCAGARFKEGSNINKSLLALGNCINALADGQRHIPYRDSKLTRLLKDSLGGNCQTVMIANISPAHHTYEDTHNTLKYATRAKNIKFQLKKNIVSVQLHVSHYIKMVEDLQAEVARLKNQSVSEAQSFKAENELLRKELEEYKIQNLAVPSLTYEHSSHLPPAIAAVNSEMRSAVSVSSIATNTSPVKETENQKDYKAFLEEAEKLYSDKAAIHQRYLSMNSSDKVLRWRIKMKQRTIDRVVAMSSTPSRLDLAQTKVDKSVEKFEAMISTANDCQEAVSEEEREINLKLLRIQEELRERGVFDQVAPFWNAFELRFLNQELSLKCQNLEKLVKYLDHSFERHDEMLQNVSALFRKYYNLVRGHGHMNEELRKEHEAVMQALEGMKFVQFEPKATTVYFSPLEIDGDRPLMPETRFENQSEIASASRLQQVSAPGSPLVNSLSQSGNVLDKALDLQSPVNISSSNSNALSKHMDTVSMLGNLEVLDSKVDNILNTSISSTAVEVGCKWNDVEAGLISEDERIPLNTTFDADGNLNATFTKDDSPEIQNNLNETFDKPEDEAAAEPSISNLNMNETFLMKERSCNQKTETELKMQRLLPVQSIPSPQLSGGRSPIEKNVNSHLIKYEKSPLIESSRIPSPRSPLRLKVSGTKDSLNSPLTSLAAGFEKKQEASSSTSQPNNTAMKTSVLSSNSTSSVASTQIKMPASSSPSCTQFVVPSSAPVKSIPSGRRVVKAGAVEKRKAPSLAIGSNTVLPIKSTSSSIGRDRRALAPVLKLPSSTPNKIKPIWNKENRSTSANTLLKSLPLNKVTKLSGGIKPVMRPPVTSVLANPSPK